MKIIDGKLLDAVSAEARANVRGRKNWNLHPDDGFCCHRLLNAIEPDSYIRPHLHLDPNKDETFVILRGRLGVLIFDEAGEVVGKVLLEAGGQTLGVDVPHGTYHTAVSLAPGTVFFEAKAGPFLPKAPAEQAPWSPLEGSPEAAGYLARLARLFV